MLRIHLHSKTDCYTVTSSFTQTFDPDWGGSDIDDDNVKVNLWSCVWFGNYYQSDEKGQTKDPIKWRVLKKDGNDLYLMADKLLDVSLNASLINVTFNHVRSVESLQSLIRHIVTVMLRSKIK